MAKDKRFNISTPEELGDRIEALATDLGISRSNCCRMLMQAGLDIRENNGVISDEQAVVRSLNNLSLAGLVRVSSEISSLLLQRLPAEIAEAAPVSVRRNTIVVLIEQNLESVSRFFLLATNGKERLESLLAGNKPQPEDLPLLEAGLASTTRQQLEEICRQEFKNGNNSNHQSCGRGA